MLAWHAYVQRSATAHPKQPGGAPTVGILRTCSLHLVSPICFPQIISWKCSQCAIGSSSELLATTTSSSTGNCWRGLFHAWASQERVLATNRITFRKRELPGASIGASSELAPILALESSHGSWELSSTRATASGLHFPQESSCRKQMGETRCKLLPSSFIIWFLADIDTSQTWHHRRRIMVYQTLRLRTFELPADHLEMTYVLFRLCTASEICKFK